MTKGSSSSGSGASASSGNTSSGYTVTSSGTNSQVRPFFSDDLTKVQLTFVGQPLLLPRLRLRRVQLQLLPLLQLRWLLLLLQPQREFLSTYSRIEY